MTEDLRSLFYPSSIAVVGASDSGAGAMPIENFRTFQYRGGIYPVNPKYEELGGHKCYASLLDIPESVDCAIIRLPAAACPEILRQCAQKDIHAAVMFAGGFGEIGGEGIALEAEVKQIAKENKISICGPNGMGILNVSAGIPIYMSHALPRKLRTGNVSFLSQSGSVLIGFFGADFGLGYSHIISSGNQTVLNPGDYVQFLAEDENTGVIAMYLESIGDKDKLEEGLRLANKNCKPVLILKAGRSEQGRLATQTHTGALAGSYDAFLALASRYNVVVADDLEQLIINCKLFSEAGYKSLPQGIGVTTVSGGHKVLAQDIGEDIGLKYATLSTKTEQALAKVLPSISHLENPIDVTGVGVGNYDIHYNSMKALAEDADIGVLLLLQDSCPNLSEGLCKRYGEHARAAADISRSYPEKMVIFLNGISNGFSEVIGAQLLDSKVIYLAGMRNSLLALRNYLRWQKKVEAQYEPVKTPRPNQERKRKWQQLFAQYRGQCLPDDLAFSLLADYEMPVAPYALVGSAELLPQKAQELKYPVVLKLLLDGVSHKSELDLIRLDIENERQLLTASAELLSKAGSLPYTMRGFLLQKMVKGDCELLLAIKQEPGFGFTCVCALGGIFVEIFKDSALSLLPVTGEDIDKMLQNLKGYPLLTGARGRARIDTAPLTDTAPKLNMLVEELGEEIKALEMNPLIAAPTGIWAVDALLELQPGAVTPRA